MNIQNKKCGCKGIRTCLLCEREKGVISSDPSVAEEIINYIYCPYCNLCWSEETAKVPPNPMYLGKILLIPEFISEEEELCLVSSIDEIEWMPSQSGRRKQDFGPKANFKKKKAKVGNFKGFPMFAKSIIERLQSTDDLTDFLPVELCHLEYTPDRGSAIEPHIDDHWLWGPRLVTINLLSPTVLILTPAASCLENPIRCNSFRRDIIATEGLCKHKLYSRFSSTDDSENTIETHSKEVKDFCSVHFPKELRISVHVTLPPRSLFVLSGCARFNWFHQIRRSDVTSRRLAMTFRELSEDFLVEKKDFGEEILRIAKSSVVLS